MKDTVAYACNLNIQNGGAKGSPQVWGWPDYTNNCISENQEEVRIKMRT